MTGPYDGVVLHTGQLRDLVIEVQGTVDSQDGTGLDDDDVAELLALYEAIRLNAELAAVHAERVPSDADRP